MLCGEFVRTSPLSFTDTRSPYFTLLALSQGMADVANDDDDIFLGKYQEIMTNFL